MTDYYETKSQPITKAMIWQAYQKVKSNKSSSGVDAMDWTALERSSSKHLYKLWNRMSSGSYFPDKVKEVAIEKKSGGLRKLGIPTLLDRIAQQVVKHRLEQKVEPLFHTSSYGYRPARNCHQAVRRVIDNIYTNDWVIDIDIKGFFDTIDHALLMKAVQHYCSDKWVLLYVERWLQAKTQQADGMIVDRITGTPQGGVISPLLANIFLHVVFDKWMDKNHAGKPFVRYADDIIVHCKTERQAKHLLKEIITRFTQCNLAINTSKTRIVQMRCESEKKYPRSFDFLGFTIQLYWSKTKGGFKLIPKSRISTKSITHVLEKDCLKKVHKWRGSLITLAHRLNPVIRGVIAYYCKDWKGHTYRLWMTLNKRLQKWVRWEKGLSKLSAIRWLRIQYLQRRNLFEHWRLAHP